MILQKAALPASCLLTIFLAAGAFFPARAASPLEVVTLVQKKYDATQAFKVYFRQTARLKTSGVSDHAEGWLYFKKPAQMRWQYLEPPGQRKEVITDGRQVWIYTPQDHIVMIYPLNKVLRSDLVLRFFSGIGQIQQDFAVAWDPGYQPGSPYKIELRPKKPAPELKELILTVDPQTYLVQALQFSNAYGDQTTMRFDQPQLNLRLEPGFFTFTPPPGVEVVKESDF